MKRSRAPNFSNGEIMHLLQLVKKYPAIENKKTDSATTRDKQEAWQALAILYNSTTTGVPRTAENLMACYKNQKIKVKKQYSNEKLSIKAPQKCEVKPGSSLQNDIILDAVEILGQNWDLVAESTNIESEECKAIFDRMVKQAKKQDADYVKDIKRTGGGPPPQPPNDTVLEKVKVLIGPSLEGLYTEHGGDYEYMKQQQDLLPAEKKSLTIEQASPTGYIKTFNTIDEDVIPKSSPLCGNTTGTLPRRLDLLRKKVDPSLDVPTTSKGKPRKTAATSYLELAEEKKELIKLKTTLANNQLVHQQEINAINLAIAKEKQEFEKKKNEMELNYIREKYELELQLIRDRK